MTDTAKNINYIDDDRELLVENIESSDGDGANDVLQLPEGYKPRAVLLRLAESSRMSARQCPDFLAYVELDILRKTEERLNLQPLFEACCRNSSKSWLNPVPFINKLDIKLEKFLCSGKERSRILSPLTVLLSEIAEHGIDPAAFLQYVILPRIEDDNDWRRWNEKHLDALKLISELLISMNGVPPFDKEHIGSKDNRLVRDVVLVKYVGRPLAGFSYNELAKDGMLQKYRKAWQMLSLDNPFTIKNKGFSNYDFVMELRAYLSIIIALLGTGSGVYLCGYFAAKLSALKDPNAAKLLERLILAIEDNGGKNIYIWHTRRMLSLPSKYREGYIDMIEANGGVDPAYPVFERYFGGNGLEQFSEKEFNKKMKALGITIDDFESSSIIQTLGEKGEIRIPHHAWITAYLKHYPERKAEIDKYKCEVINGIDREWNNDRVKEIDNLGIPMHRPLLHSVIPGLSGAALYKSNSFAGLMFQYGEVTEISSLKHTHEFRMPVQEISSFDKFQTAEIRSQVNMTVIKNAWSCIENKDTVHADNVTNFLNMNMEYTKLKNAYALKDGELLEAGRVMASLPEGEKRGEIEKQLKSIEKCAGHIEARMELYESLLIEVDFMNNNEKTITALIVAGKEASTGDDFTRFVISLFLERYTSDTTLQGRFEALRSDVAIDLIHLKQLEMLVETIDTLGRTLAAERELANTIDSMISHEEKVIELLTPFIVIKSKKLTMETLDAALRKITSFARLTAERAKWQEIQESFNDQGKRFFEPYRIYASRSIIDAYYGDMGSICISAIPEAVKNPALQVFRLVSDSDKKLKGLCSCTGPVEVSHLI